MAELFNSITDFKAQVGGAVNATLELDSIGPTIADTARLHLVPYLGFDTYLALVVYVADPPDPDDLALKALLPYVRRSLAMLTMAEYSKIGSVNFSESGMYRTETERMKPTYRYQAKDYYNYMLENGYNAIEEMLRFLSTHQVDYPDWIASDESMMHRSPLLNYAADLRRLMYTQCDRWTFECLRPLIAQVEMFTVATVLPAAYYAALQQRHATNTSTEADKRLIDKIRSAIGQRAYDEALKQQIVQVKGGRVIVIEEFGEQSAVNKTIPNQILLGYSRHEIFSNMHAKMWRDYAFANVTTYPTLFDVASGGTSMAVDAWHVPTADEEAQAARTQGCTNNGPVYHF